MWVAEGQDLGAVLTDFKERFNNNPRARKVAVGWDRVVVLDSTDSGRKYELVVANSEVTGIRTLEDVDDDRDDVVRVQGEEKILMDVFSGRYNPATALTDGNLAVFSSDRDKVKLEALAMVIWRLG